MFVENNGVLISVFEILFIDIDGFLLSSSQKSLGNYCKLILYGSSVDLNQITFPKR